MTTVITNRLCRFWCLPNGKRLAFVPRTGSTAWAHAILAAFYPNVIPPGTPKNQYYPQLALPAREGQVTGEPPFLCVVRDPVERFRSAYVAVNKDGGLTVDAFIAQIEAGGVDIHMASIAVIFAEVWDHLKWYKYERDLPQLAQDIGLASVPEEDNVSAPEAKPELTSTQLAWAQAYYAKDIALWNSL